MAQTISTFTKRVPPGAAAGGTLQALMLRQQQAAKERDAAGQMPGPIASPWQGAAHIGNIIASGINEGRASRAESAARAELAQLMSGYDPEKSGSDFFAQVGMYDEGLRDRLMEEAAAVRRDAATRQHAVTMQDDSQAFTGGENRMNREQEAAQFDVTSGLQRETLNENIRGNKAGEGLQRATLDENIRGNQASEGLQRATLDENIRGNQAAETNAGELLKIQQEQLAQSKLSDQPVAELTRAFKAGEITKEVYDAAIAKETQLDLPKPGETMMPGMIEIDKKFAPEVLEWDQSGGANAEKAISQVNAALQILETKGPTGFWAGATEAVLPEVFAKYVNPDGTIARDAIRETVQQTLRQALGAQFTQQEGEGLMNRAFDINLDPKENIRRAKLLLRQIQTTARNKAMMVDHFKRNGTLQGYAGPAYDLSSVSNIDFGDGPGGGAPAPAGGGGSADIDAILQGIP